MEELVKTLCVIAYIISALVFFIILFAMTEITLIEFIREKRRLKREMKVWQLAEILYNIDTYSNKRCENCKKRGTNEGQCPDICFSIETARYLTSKGVKVKRLKKDK